MIPFIYLKDIADLLSMETLMSDVLISDNKNAKIHSPEVLHY